MEKLEITSAKYTLDKMGVPSAIIATVEGETMSVPLDPNNRHYAEIMRQVEAGELTIQEATN